MSIDWNINTYSSLSSTQTYGMELAEEGLPEGTVIQSLIQTKGRGQHGREWQSPMGNLYMSFILRPDCKAIIAPELSFVIAVAVSRAIGHYMGKGHEKTLKWPNDILVNGKKCAGILIETHAGKKGKVDAVVVGTGVNILAAPEGAIAVQDICKGQVAIHPFRDQVLAEVSAAYKKWKKEGFKPIREEWMEQIHGLDQKIKIVSGDNEQTGILKGIDESGALLLEKNKKAIVVLSGSLIFE